MAYKYGSLPDLNLVHVVFEGEISYEEEVEAFEMSMQDERMQPNSRFLVDRRNSRMLAAPPDADAHIRLIKKHESRLGRPTMAVVVGEDYDFGMLRVLESKAETQIDHVFRVFRSITEACEWLGIEEGDLDQV